MQLKVVVGTSVVYTSVIYMYLYMSEGVSE